ncbi:hypothetical protein CR513_61607, partial [Mucuna pruriens]
MSPTFDSVSPTLKHFTQGSQYVLRKNMIIYLVFLTNHVMHVNFEDKRIPFSIIFSTSAFHISYKYFVTILDNIQGFTQIKILKTKFQDRRF